MEINLEKIEEPILKRLKPFLKKLEAVDPPPRAAMLIGPAVRGEFSEKNPEINTLLVYEVIDAELLDKLAGLGKSFGAEGIRAPLLLTPDYLKHARDVFPMEFFNLRANHVVLSGKSLLDDVDIDESELRLQCERELRSLRLQLRQGYLRSAGDGAWMAAWFTGMIPELFNVFRPAAHLLGADSQVGNTVIAASLKERTGIDLSAFVQVWELRKQGEEPDKKDVKDLFNAWENGLAALVEKVDALG